MRVYEDVDFVVGPASPLPPLAAREHGCRQWIPEPSLDQGVDMTLSNCGAENRNIKYVQGRIQVARACARGEAGRTDSVHFVF